MTKNVQSEVGQLRQVIVHRPGLELARLTPSNIGDLLFDDVMWASKAREEHDVFADVLRDQGVQVHHFGQLLTETLLVPEGRAYVLDQICTPEMVGPELVDELRRLTDDAGRGNPGRVPDRRGAQGRRAAAAVQEPEVGDATGR